MTLNAAQLGFVRALGTIILMSVLSYLGDSAHLSGVVTVGAAGIISSLALSFEHMVEATGKGALFGMVKS